ncbi:hypothetical protein K2331_004643 [Salmonella enterica]|nr:hypothetical protein [Salmonella enterica]
MKKTLIALAVAVSAAVSGAAMAWDTDGTGGNVELGGTLTPADVVTPWEVKVGAPVNGLDANISKGDTKVNIPVTNAIPVLVIRTIEKTAFQGRAGIDPKISYNRAVDFENMKDGVAELILDILGSGDSKIGTLRADIFTGAGIARERYSVSVYDDGGAFAGGLGSSDSKVVGSFSTLVSKLNAIDPEIIANFDDMGTSPQHTWNAGSFSDKGKHFSAFYGSAIEAGKSIKITLDTPAVADAPIDWKASLPITVSYQ